MLTGASSHVWSFRLLHGKAVSVPGGIQMLLAEFGMPCACEHRKPGTVTAIECVLKLDLTPVERQLMYDVRFARPLVLCCHSQSVMTVFGINTKLHITSTLTSAPFDNSSSRIFNWPLDAAFIIAVCPCGHA